MMCKVSNVYVGMYLGFIDVYGTPAQYPYPLLIGGNMRGAGGATERRFSDSTVYNSNFYNGGGESSYSCCYLRNPNGVWQNVFNFYSSGRTNYYSINIQPFYFLHDKTIKQTDGGNSLLMRAILYENYNGKTNLWGELDGVFASPSQTLSAEDFQDFVGGKYVTFPNVFRTDIKHLATLKLD